MARGRVAAVSDTSNDVGYEPSMDYGNLEDYSSNYSDWLVDPNCDIDYSSHPKIVAQHYIELVVFPVLLFQGILGNGLAIPTLISLGRSAWSTLLYLAMLGLTDLILLLTRCGDTWYLMMTKISLIQILLNSSDAACRTYYFAFAFVEHINPWLMVAAAVEMTITAKWPTQSHVACTMERARYVMMLLTLIMVCLDINHFWTYGVPNGPAAAELGCRYVEDFSKNFRDWIWPALNNAVLLFLPLVAVGLCFIITTTTLLQRTHDREEDMRSNMRKYFLELPAVIDFRTIVLVVSAMFLVLIIFQTICNVLMLLLSRGFLEMEGCESEAEFGISLVFFQTLDRTFRFMFYGGKIYLYIGLSPAFRARLALGFRAARGHLTRLVRFCSCTCSGGTPRWTLVARDDDSTRKRPRRDQGEPQLLTEPRTTSIADDPVLGARNFESSENGASGITQSNHCAAGPTSSDNVQIFFADNVPSQPSQSLSQAYQDRTGQNGRNGAAMLLRPGDHNNIGSSKPQRCRPIHQTPRYGSDREHIVIALNSNKTGQTQSEHRPVSYGDHLV